MFLSIARARFALCTLPQLESTAIKYQVNFVREGIFVVKIHGNVT